MSEEKTKKQRQAQKGGPPHGPGGHGPGGMMPGDKPKNLKASLLRLVQYLKKSVPLLIVCFVLAVSSTILSTVGPKILGGATNELFSGMMEMVAGSDQNGDGIIGISFKTIRNILLFCGGIYLASAILQYILYYILTGISNRLSYGLREQISLKINRMPLSYFDRVSYGDILSRITNDVDTLTQTLVNSAPDVIMSITRVLGAVIMMFTINPWMTLATLLILPVSGIVVMQIVKRSQPHYVKQQGYLGEVNGQVEEMYSGHLVVRAFNREDVTEEEFTEVNDKLYNSAWKSQFLGGMMMPVMGFIGNLGYVLVCILGGRFALAGTITVGDIQAFIQYVRSFTQPITQIANSSNILQQTAAAAERVFEFLDEAEEAPDPETPVEVESTGGSVFFAHVGFGYVPEKQIIHDFSAIIKPGQKVAIVGPTGAGKTTMVKLLMRFYDVNSGAILVDEYDVKQYRRGDLRGKFGMVLQDTWLYNDTIMENIRYGRLDATDEEVIAAAKAAQADRFIRTLPDGYNMVLNEEASNISQGQKQLLTIARTILSEPTIMILDEATSSVDTRTEMAIQKAMNKLMEGRTSFIIAHRLSTIRDADMILVMRDGDVVETGTHNELLEKEGFYAQLYNSQFTTGAAI